MGKHASQSVGTRRQDSTSKTGLKLCPGGATDGSQGSKPFESSPSHNTCTRVKQKVREHQTLLETEADIL